MSCIKSEPNKEICYSCRKVEKDLLYAQIGVFKGTICQNCYIMKMLEEICEKLDIKNKYSSWV